MSRERSLPPSPPAAAALQCPPQTEIVDRARPFSCFVVIAHSPFPPFCAPSRVQDDRSSGLAQLSFPPFPSLPASRPCSPWHTTNR